MSEKCKTTLRGITLWTDDRNMFLFLDRREPLGQSVIDMAFPGLLAATHKAMKQVEGHRLKVDSLLYWSDTESIQARASLADSGFASDWVPVKKPS